MLCVQPKSKFKTGNLKNTENLTLHHITYIENLTLHHITYIEKKVLLLAIVPENKRN